MKQLALALAITACGAPQVGVVSGEGVVIPLVRRAQAGLRYRVTATVLVDARVTHASRGETREDNGAQGQLDFEADVEIEAVDEHGQPTLSRATIARARWSDAEGDRELFRPGTVIHVTALAAPDQGSLSSDTGPLPEREDSLLRLLFTTQVGGAHEDDIYRTRAPRRIGERWEIDTALAAGEAPAHIRLRPEQMSGEMTFVDREQVGGAPCLHVLAEVRAEGFELAGLPVTTDRASMETLHESWLPTDGGLRRRQRTVHLYEIVQRAREEDGSESTRAISHASEVRADYAYAE
jgi:hypothetical protein